MKTQRLSFLNEFAVFITALAVLFTPFMMQAQPVIGEKHIFVKGDLPNKEAVNRALKAELARLAADNPGYDVEEYDDYVGVVVPASDSPADIAAARVKANALGQQLMSQKADPKVIAECGVAIVVLGVGTIVVYKLYRLCQKKFPKVTNDPPVVPPTTNAPPKVKISSGRVPNGQLGDNASSGDTNVYAAYFVFTPTPSTPSPADTGMGFSVPYRRSGSNSQTATLGQASLVASGDMVDLNEFANQLSSLGLVFSTKNASFSSNGIPVPSLSQIQLGSDGTIIVNTGTSTNVTTNVFMRSLSVGPDAAWVPLLKTVVIGDYQGKFVDGSPPAGSAFYKVIVNP